MSLRHKLCAIQILGLLLLVQSTLALRCAAATTLVVCPPTLRPALERWVVYRQGQGYDVRVIAPANTAQELRSAIRREAEQRELHFLVLIGDAPSLSGTRNVDQALQAPVGYVPARVIPRFGGERHIATDNIYADLDDDSLPDIAVGRMTADSPIELANIVEKVIAYESSLDFGTWRRQINLVAGVGGFGGLIDGVIEGTTKMFLTAGVPAGYQTSMTQASWTSPYCPDPRRFRETTISRLNEGCLFWIYMGHGNPRTLDTVDVPGGRFPILSTADIDNVRCRHTAPIALFFCCYAGAIDAREDCLAEEMLRQPNGPTAVVAGSRVTMPYAMATLGSALLGEYFHQQRATLGELLLQAKRSMAVDASQNRRRQAIDSLGKLLSGPGHNLAHERQEHLHLFNLIGDPLLRLKYPQRVELTAPQQAAAGSDVTVRATTPVAGRALVELVVRRDRFTQAPPKRLEFLADDASMAAFQGVYARANDPQLAAVESVVEEGSFSVTLRVPPAVQGACHVRVYIHGLRSFGLGACDIRIVRPVADDGR